MAFIPRKQDEKILEKMNQAESKADLTESVTQVRELVDYIDQYIAQGSTFFEQAENKADQLIGELEQMQKNVRPDENETLNDNRFQADDLYNALYEIKQKIDELRTGIRRGHYNVLEVENVDDLFS